MVRHDNKILHQWRACNAFSHRICMHVIYFKSIFPPIHISIPAPHTYIHAYIFVYAHIHACLHIYIHTYGHDEQVLTWNPGAAFYEKELLHRLVCAYMHISVPICMYLCLYVCVFAYVHVLVPTYLSNVHLRLHACIQASTHAWEGIVEAGMLDQSSVVRPHLCAYAYVMVFKRRWVTTNAVSCQNTIRSAQWRGCEMIARHQCSHAHCDATCAQPHTLTQTNTCTHIRVSRLNLEWRRVNCTSQSLKYSFLKSFL